MDALRASAVLMVVSTHAAVAYTNVQVPGLLWAIHDRSTSRWMDWVFWWCNGVSMPLFFLLAGFFAELVYDERGPGTFLWHRTKRLLVPFVTGCLVILPVTFYVWASGWLLAGRCTLKEILRVQFDPSMQANLYGPAHLWFLEYLFLLCLLFAGVGLLRMRRARLRFHPPVPLLCVGLTVLILWVDPGAPIHFHNSFVPDPARFCYYATFFMAGMWWFRRGDLSTSSGWVSAVWLVVSLVAFCAVAWLLPRHLSVQLHGLSRLFLAVATVLFVWFAVLGLVGMAQHFFDQEHVSIAYVAAASYWIYLVHFPVVGLAQVAASALPGPALVKYLAVFVVAMLVSVLSYEHFVRRTFVGRWLNGTQRVAPRADRPRHASAGAVAEAR